MDKDKFDLEDFLNIDKKMINRIYNIRKEFSVPTLDDKLCFGVMDFVGYPLLLEAEKYYNGELLSAFAIYKAMREYNKELRSYAYSFENLVFRLIAFWEYFYQFLNMYFQLGLFDDTSIKKMIERVGYDIEFIKKGDVTKVEYVPLPEEEQKKKRRVLRNELVRINKWNTIRAISAIYEPTNKIEELIDTITGNNVETLKNTRNQIIHQRPAGARVTVNFDEIFMNGYSMSVNGKGWIDFNKIDKEIVICLNSIRNCFDVIYHIIKFNEYPNRIENAGKEYFIKIVTCSICKAEYCIPDFLLGEKDKFAKVIICPHCGEMGCKVGKRKKVTEIDYGTIYGNYIRLLEELNKDIDDDEL